MQVLKHEQCDSLNDYLSKYKTICKELVTIEKLLTNDQKSFLILNGPGANYQMHTTMALKLPLPDYSKILSILNSDESHIILQAGPDVVS